MPDKYADTDSSISKQSKQKLHIVKFRLNIGDADRDRFIKKAADFLSQREQVKVLVQLRGREKARPEKGLKFLEEVIGSLANFGSPANSPTKDSLFITFNPKARS